MSNFDRAVKALDGVDEAIDHLADNSAYVTALAAAGLLAPDLQIIRTVEELEALDPDTRLLTATGSALTPRGVRFWTDFSDQTELPAMVIATGDQVRAARKALEKEHE